MACNGLMRGKALPSAEHSAPCIPAYWPPGRRRPHKLQAAPFTPTSAVSYVPVLDRVTASAPATIANLGPGFDWLGCAVEVESHTGNRHPCEDSYLRLLTPGRQHASNRHLSSVLQLA